MAPCQVVAAAGARRGSRRAPVDVDSVWFPVPPLTNAAMMSVLPAVVLESTPENVGLVLSLPMVSETFVPALVLLVTLPAPANEPTLWLKPFNRNVALEATEIAENREMALATPAWSVKPEPLILVGPV